MQFVRPAFEVINAKTCRISQFFKLGVLRRQELMQRRIEQSDRRWQAVHDAEQGGEILALVRKQLGDRGTARVRIAGEDLFGLFDLFASSIMLPLSGIFAALFVGWSLSKRDALAAAQIDGVVGTLWIWLLRLFVPGMIALVLLHGITDF